MSSYPSLFKALGLGVFLIGIQNNGFAQRYLSDYDSSLFIKDTVRPVVGRFNNLVLSGYLQPQYQVIQEKGAASYAGGNFQEYSNNRFMLRRARVRLDYRMPGKIGNFPAALFTFQFEATERDVNVRDMFVRIYEPAKNKFSLTAGLFARPFGFEVNLSSSYRETPERGRMSQILMPSERDLGAMVTYESKKATRYYPAIKFDIGVFNGQGKSGPAEFDSYKDIISRLFCKPFQLSNTVSLSGGLSFLRGGWAQATKYKYEMSQQNGDKIFVIDSSRSNVGGRAPREYYGADAQLVFKNAWGKTEVRGEYWRGTQSGTALTTVNPGTLPLLPTFVRNFDGAFIYLLQNIGNSNWEIMAKYDWYDPNTRVSGTDIGKEGAYLTLADIKYSTLGLGMTHYFNDHLKMLIYYDMVSNEKTILPGFTSDLKDNVFTFRIQMKF